MDHALNKISKSWFERDLNVSKHIYIYRFPHTEKICLNLDSCDLSSVERHNFSDNTTLDHVPTGNDTFVCYEYAR